MKRKKKQNEEGFVLVAALLILLVLTVMGIAVNRNTTTEVKIALNDRIHKETFYAADAVTELATEVLVQSIACFGFKQVDETNDNIDEGVRIPGAAGHDLYIEEGALGFWRNYNIEGTPIPSDDDDADGFPDRHMVYPAVFDTAADGTKVFNREETNAQPHANISIGGNTKLEEGSAILMNSGYDGGEGKSLSAGGVSLVYDVNVQQKGRDGSESIVCIQYKHRPDSEGDCNY